MPLLATFGKNCSFRKWLSIVPWISMARHVNGYHSSSGRRKKLFVTHSIVNFPGTKPRDGSLQRPCHAVLPSFSGGVLQCFRPVVNMAHVLARAKYPTLFKVHNQMFTAVFTREHKPSYSAQMALTDSSHTLHHRSLTRFLALPRNMLWVNVSANHVQGPSVRRKRYRRMLEAALYEALRDTGFNSNAILWTGKRAEMRKRSEENTGKSLEGALTGTLELFVQKTLQHMQWAEVKKQADFIAKKLQQVSTQKIIGRQVRKAA